MSLSRSTIRETERQSIRKFVEDNAVLLSDRTLDYGCLDSPYKDLVTGEYVGWDVGQPKPTGLFDAVLCTQVMEYVSRPKLVLQEFFDVLRPGGKLLLTYPTLWEEVEQNDYWRFTKAGMELLLHQAGFNILVHERRCEIRY